MLNEIEYSKVMKNNPLAASQGSPGKWARWTRRAVACSALVLGTVAAMAQLAVSPLAGNPATINPGSADGTGTAASFNNPTGVAVDSSGNVYIADVNNHKIRKITSAGVVTTLAGSGSAGSTNSTGTASSFNTPYGVATDGTNVYVADYGNHLIRQIVIATGATTTIAGTANTSGTADGTGAAARFNNPTGLVVVGTDLYVTDLGNNTIRKVVISTGVVTTIAGTASATTGSADGTGTAATFGKPFGITAEGTTNLYVADSFNNTIRKIVIATGVVTTFAGTAGAGGNADGTAGTAAFKTPTGIALSGANLYVADTANNCIKQIVIATQAVTTVLGSTSGLTGNFDAIGTNARFSAPTGLGANSGLIYISDTTNQRIRVAGAAVAPTVSNPSAQSVTAGNPANFTVTVTGNPSPTIQWERQAAGTTGFVALTNGGTYSGVTTVQLTVSGTTSIMNGDLFRATVTNGVGAAVSSTVPAALSIQAAPAFTSAASAVVALNAPINFTFTATGSPAPTFSVIAGSFPGLFASLNPTTGALTGTPTAGTSPSSSYTFTVQASNGIGSPVTQSFTLTIQNGAVITSQPNANVTVAPGIPASFTVGASGNPNTFTYQWYRQAAGTTGFFQLTDVAGFYSGTTLATLTVVNPTTFMNGDQFQVIVSNGIGSTVTSTPATLTVAVAPQFTSANSTIFAFNQSNFFQVVATGTPTPTYSIVSGSQPTTWALSLNPTTGALTGTPPNNTGAPFVFTIRATNAAGVVDQSFSLDVTPAGAFPAVTTQPVSVTATLGDPVTFTVVGTGSPAPTYQWQRQLAAGGGFFNLTEGDGFSGTQTATLTILNAKSGMSGDQFQVVLSNTVNGQAASATSNPATLTVNIGTIITTIAGAVGQTALLDGVGTAARFVSPNSVAVDVNGNIYVADTTAQVIRKITPAGVVTTIAGVAGSSGSTDGAPGVARFYNPQGVAVDGAGNIFVADTSNHTIRLINATTGVVSTLAGSATLPGSADGFGSTARFSLPYAVAVNINTNAIYVADTNNHTIRLVTYTGSVATIAGLAGNPGSTDGAGNAARFKFPSGIAVDSGNNVYVADTGSGTVRKIVSNSIVSTYAGTAGFFGNADGAALTVARFNQPTGIAVDSTGTVYVSDILSNNIRRISTAGDVTTVAGATTQPSAGSADGTGTAARFSQPTGIAVDTAGNLYIADLQNRTIRRSGALIGAAITTQPVNASTAPGGTATFTVAASGTPAPTSYLWQRKPFDNSTDFVTLIADATYSGINTPQLTISNVAATMNGDQFRVIVSNFINPDAVSNTVTLSTVIAPPTFTSPNTVAFKATELGAFTVTTSGNPGPSYSVSGTLPTWLTLNPTSGVLSGTPPDTTGSPFSFTIVANNGIAVSQSFVLTVNPAVVAPAIVTQPVGLTVGRGNTAAFTVLASGTDPRTYEWSKDGQVLTGATGAVLTLNSVQPANAGSYTVKVSNAAGSVTSTAAVLAVSAPPVITSQPASQTVAASSTVVLSVGVSATPAATYQWRFNGNPITSGGNGSTLTLTDVQAVNVGGYDVIVRNGVGGDLLSSLAQLSITSTSAAPVITSVPAPRTVILGSTTTLTVGYSAVPAPTFQWRKDGQPVAGGNVPTLTLPNVTYNDAGNYTLTITNSVASVESAKIPVTVVRRSYAGAYFGTLSGNAGSFAIYVRPDNTGVLLGYLPGVSTGIRQAELQVSDQGQFTYFQPTFSLSGTIADSGAVTGSISGLGNPTLSGTKSSDTGATGGLAGIYQAGAANTSSNAYAIVSGAGQAFILVQSGGALDGGTSVLEGNNRFSLVTARQSIVATIKPDNGDLEVTVTTSGGSTTFNGGSEATISSQRLANISSRANVSSGTSVVITGFVISGQQSKPVLIRAVGPGLAPYGVSSFLPAPKLELYRAGTTAPIATNIGWGTAGNTAAIAAAAARAGAFSLTANSADSVIFTTLAPGTYTAQISSNTGVAGVALAEVYDLSAPAAGQKLFNISTRASTGDALSTFSAGIVVTGTTPKRVLIRGVGPGLLPFEVTNAVLRPQINVINNATQATVATNSNWNLPAESAAAISAAGDQVGAFRLTPGVSDAALIVNLAPGAYSVQAVAANGANGVALIEVYELP